MRVVSPSDNLPLSIDASGRSKENGYDDAFNRWFEMVHVKLDIAHCQLNRMIYDSFDRRWNGTLAHSGWRT